MVATAKHFLETFLPKNKFLRIRKNDKAAWSRVSLLMYADHIQYWLVALSTCLSYFPRGKRLYEALSSALCFDQSSRERRVAYVKMTCSSPQCECRPHSLLFPAKVPVCCSISKLLRLVSFSAVHNNYGTVYNNCWTTYDCKTPYTVNTASSVLWNPAPTSADA